MTEAPRQLLQLGFSPDLRAKLVALLVDACDDRAHREADIYEYRL